MVLNFITSIKGRGEPLFLLHGGQGDYARLGIPVFETASAASRPRRRFTATFYEAGLAIHGLAQKVVQCPVRDSGLNTTFGAKPLFTIHHLPFLQETTLKRLTIFMTALLLCTTIGPIAESQTRTRRSSPSRRRTPARPATVLSTPGMTRTPSGLIYIITRRSTGQLPKAGEIVAVNYTGLLGSGVKFDSSLDRGQPIRFPLGKGRVIKGWDEGIAKLRVGEQATLIISPGLGYGAKGFGDVIPPDATLIFIVELMAVEGAPISN